MQLDLIQGLVKAFQSKETIKQRFKRQVLGRWHHFKHSQKCTCGGWVTASNVTLISELVFLMGNYSVKCPRHRKAADWELTTLVELVINCLLGIWRMLDWCENAWRRCQRWLKFVRVLRDGNVLTEKSKGKGLLGTVEHAFSHYCGWKEEQLEF